MSWVASALPAKTVWIQPSRINRATWGTEPVCTIAGPPTIRTFLPAARVWRIASATLRRLTDLGFSLETVELMKPKRLDSRGRSTGSTRTPAWPTTIGIPTVTRIMGTHRAVAAFGVKDDPAVHLLVLNVDPAPPVANLGPLVRRAVKRLRKRAGDVGRNRARVLGVNRRGPVLDQVAEDGVDRLGRLRLDPDPRIARVGSPNADLALVDLERAPHLENPIEDLGKQQRVDDVSPDLDLVDGPGGRTSGPIRPALTRVACATLLAVSSDVLTSARRTAPTADRAGRTLSASL